MDSFLFLENVTIYQLKQIRLATFLANLLHCLVFFYLFYSSFSVNRKHVSEMGVVPIIHKHKVRRQQERSSQDHHNQEVICPVIRDVFDMFKRKFL
jgi:hypothetical protein